MKITKKAIVCGLFSLFVVLAFTTSDCPIYSPTTFVFSGIAKQDGYNLKDLEVQVELSIFNSGGDIVFTETHTANTNKDAEFFVPVGAGQNQSNPLSQIDWRSDAYTAQAVVKYKSNVTLKLPVKPILSAPVALYADRARTSDDWVSICEPEPLLYRIPGKVAIGKGNAVSKFDVAGDIRGEKLFVDGPQYNTLYGPNKTLLEIKAGTQNAPQAFRISTDSQSKINGLIQGNMSVQKGNMSIENGHLLVGTNIKPLGGHVGVFKGSILCTTVQIEYASNWKWPDYVFAPDYDLEPLSTVEDFINSKGHLPGFPSSQEVHETGFDVTEMIVKLTEKVEELTLHTIEQEKQINRLSAKIKDQE